MSAVCLHKCVCASVCVLALIRQGVDWQTPQNPLIEFLLVCHSSFIGAFLAFCGKQVGCHSSTAAVADTHLHKLENEMS